MVWHDLRSSTWYTRTYIITGKHARWKVEGERDGRINAWSDGHTPDRWRWGRWCGNTINSCMPGIYMWMCSMYHIIMCIPGTTAVVLYIHIIWIILITSCDIYHSPYYLRPNTRRVHLLHRGIPSMRSPNSQCTYMLWIIWREPDRK